MSSISFTVRRSQLGGETGVSMAGLKNGFDSYRSPCGNEWAVFDEKRIILHCVPKAWDRNLVLCEEGFGPCSWGSEGWDG